MSEEEEPLQLQTPFKYGLGQLLCITTKIFNSQYSYLIELDNVNTFIWLFARKYYDLAPLIPI